MATVRDAGTRQDQFVLRLTIGGVSFGIWDKKTGGDLDSDSTTYYPGGMKDQQDLGGRKTAANVVLSRLYDRVDDHDKMLTYLNGVGKASVTITERPLDDDDNEYGKSIVWNGRIKRVLPPDVDSESGAAAMIEIECTIKGSPTMV